MKSLACFCRATNLPCAMRRILVRIAVALVLAAALITVIGYALPQDHVASVTGHVSMPPQSVYKNLTEVERYPGWRKDVERVEVLSRAPLRWREHGDGDVITFEVVETVPAAKVVSRIADPDLPFGGTWTYELSADGSGTRVTITERGEVYNPIFRFVSRFVIGHTATMQKVLDALAVTEHH